MELGLGVSRAGTGNLRQRHRKWWLGYILLQFALTAERTFLLSEGPAALPQLAGTWLESTLAPVVLKDSLGILLWASSGGLVEGLSSALSDPPELSKKKGSRLQASSPSMPYIFGVGLAHQLKETL